MLHRGFEPRLSDRKSDVLAEYTNVAIKSPYLNMNPPFNNNSIKVGQGDSNLNLRINSPTFYLIKLRFLKGMEGLEPPTFGLEARCSSNYTTHPK